MAPFMSRLKQTELMYNCRSRRCHLRGGVGGAVNECLEWGTLGAGKILYYLRGGYVGEFIFCENSPSDTPMISTLS